MNFDQNLLKAEKGLLEGVPVNSFVSTFIEEHIKSYKEKCFGEEFLAKASESDKKDHEKMYADLAAPLEKVLTIRSNYDSLVKDRKYIPDNEVGNIEVAFPEYIKIKEGMSPELQERVVVVNKAISNLFIYIDNPENLAKDKIRHNSDLKHVVYSVAVYLLRHLENYFEKPDENTAAYVEDTLDSVANYLVDSSTNYRDFDFNSFREIILKAVDYVEGVSKKHPRYIPATR